MLYLITLINTALSLLTKWNCVTEISELFYSNQNLLNLLIIKCSLLVSFKDVISWARLLNQKFHRKIKSQWNHTKAEPKTDKSSVTSLTEIFFPEDISNTQHKHRSKHTYSDCIKHQKSKCFKYQWFFPIGW